MTEHHVKINGGPVTTLDQVDLIHTAVEAAAGQQINTSAVEWNNRTGDLMIHLWLDAADTATAETRATAIVKIARNGDS